jgi:putative ABC transport system permease protein
MNQGMENNENQVTPAVNYHQLDRLVIQVENTTMLTSSAEILSRLLKRKHYDVVDFEIEIPELLLN